MHPLLIVAIGKPAVVEMGRLIIWSSVFALYHVASSPSLLLNRRMSAPTSHEYVRVGLRSSLGMLGDVMSPSGFPLSV